MEKRIVPAILVNNFELFKEQIEAVEDFADYVQIDVMDGKFVDNTSFEDIEKINNLDTDLKYELHLMVDDPLEEIKKWKDIKNVFRVIFHIEAKNPNVLACINELRGQCRDVGIAINPDTDITEIDEYLEQLNVVLFMTVTPGKQGQKFQEKVGEKIKEFAKLTVRPIIAVDGGIKQENIKLVDSWGVEIFNVGSALVMQPDPKAAYLELQKEII